MLKIKTVSDFVSDINQIVTNEGCTTIEAICSYAERNDVEFDKLVPFIDQSFKDVIRNEAESRNLLRKEHVQLPF